MDTYSSQNNIEITTFINESINDTVNKVHKFKQIQLSLDRLQGIISYQKTLISYFHESLINNHRDTEGINYVKNRLVYNTKLGSNISTQEDLYKDYISWNKQNKTAGNITCKNKDAFIDFINSLFKPGEYGREEKYIAYQGVTIKNIIY